MRQRGVNVKLNPLREVVRGKRLIVVDDSIVRGHDDQADRRRCSGRPARPRSTSGSARRRSSTRASTASTPQIETELIASTHTVEEIREFIGADSLGYLSIRGVLAALDLPYERFCFACFDGNYPEPVPYDVAERKFMLERARPSAGCPMARRRDEPTSGPRTRARASTSPPASGRSS